jgi:Na+-driven multidrug efflux pump
MKTAGNTLLLVAVLLALAPVMIVGRGSQPSTQIYQDAKGSWMPAAYAYANPRVFFVAAGFTGIMGAGFIFASSLGERRRRACRP